MCGASTGSPVRAVAQMPSHEMHLSIYAKYHASLCHRGHVPKAGEVIHLLAHTFSRMTSGGATATHSIGPRWAPRSSASKSNPASRPAILPHSAVMPCPFSLHNRHREGYRHHTVVPKSKPRHMLVLTGGQLSMQCIAQGGENEHWLQMCQVMTCMQFVWDAIILLCSGAVTLTVLEAMPVHRSELLPVNRSCSNKRR